MYPAFLYLMLVQVHTPTPRMFFYDCPNTGKVRDFMQKGESFEYEVAFECRSAKIHAEWFPAANLRQANPSK